MNQEETVSNLFDKLSIFGLSLGVLVVLGLAVWVVHIRLLAYYSDRPNDQQYRQLIQIVIVLLTLILAIVLMPIGADMRGQLLGFLGILLSATIALSSTTLVGNAMAGLMLQWQRNWHIGDYVRVGEHFGRISDMDLLHVEIQTEDRDLTTLPNLFVVTNPVTVLRNSGTIMHVEVSLGYDVPRHKIEAALLSAAEESGLETPFVQIRSLGDFSVLYCISGLLSDIKQLISTRRNLRANVLDSLHEAGIEIVSPNFMNTRALDPNKGIMPAPSITTDTDIDSSNHPSPDDVVFDKAHKAEALEELKREYTEMSQQLLQIEQSVKDADKAVVKGDDEQALDEAGRRKLGLEKKKLQAALTRAEKKIAAMELELG